MGAQRLESVVHHPPKPTMYRILSITAGFWVQSGAASVFFSAGPSRSVARPLRFNRAADAGS